MAIIADHVAPNFVSGNYFRILMATYRCAPEDKNPRWEFLVGFYVSKVARDSNANPAYQYQVEIPVAELDQDPRKVLYGLLANNKLFEGLNPVDDQETNNLP